MIAAMTASGGRPVCLGLCRQMMSAQTVPVEHLIDEDETIPIAPHLRMLIERALDFGAERFYVVEDDDWYGPRYVEMYEHVFRSHPWVWYVGSSRTRYYHLPSRGYVSMRHDGRSSGCSTAFTREGAEQMLAVLGSASAYPDLDMWRVAATTGRAYLFDEPTMVGMKGLPGRAGYTQGHNPAVPRPIDKDGSVLRSWVGDIWAETYESL